MTREARQQGNFNTKKFDIGGADFLGAGKLLYPSTRQNKEEAR